jgi:hypothetical protein
MSETIQLSKDDIQKIYDKGNDDVKQILASKFGQQTFDGTNHEKSVFSLEDACKINGTDPKDYIPYPNPINGDQRAINAFALFTQVTRAFNKGVKRDWKNPNQSKWYPWFRMDGKLGSGLSLGDAAFVLSTARVASRLCVLQSQHVGIISERFFKSYEDLMTETD